MDFHYIPNWDNSPDIKYSYDSTHSKPLAGYCCTRCFATYTLTLYVGKTAAGVEHIFDLGNDFLLVIFIIALGILAIISPLCF